MRKATLVAALALALTSCERKPATGTASRLARAPRPRAPLSMMALHQTGGVPPGWRFSVPLGDAAAGRRAFADLGCSSCHHIEGEPATQSGSGPDLTQMGGHHPGEYFAESILDPDAVLVEGPGYLGPDGRSVMPSYPDLTLAQLADLVAYLKSLRAPASREMANQPIVKPLAEVPSPPDSPATIWFVQGYDVQPGRLADYETWFRDGGSAALLAHDGLVSVDSWVDLTRDGATLATVIGFRDEDALRRFLDDPSADAVKAKLDEFVGPHQHRVFRHPPIYRAGTLSAGR